MDVNFSKTFLQVNHFSSFEIKYMSMILVLGGAGPREKKLLKVKRSRKTFVQDTKAIPNYIYLL